MTILTRTQYFDSVRRDRAAEYDLTLLEAGELFSDELLLAGWWRHVVQSFNAGDDFSRQAAQTLTDTEIRDLSRTERGLRDGMPKHYLRPMTKPA